MTIRWYINSDYITSNKNKTISLTDVDSELKLISVNKNAIIAPHFLH